MQTAMITGAEMIARIVSKHGVADVFSLAGGAHTFLLAGLEAHGIRIIGSRHESAAISSADGYARMRRGPGVACIIETQGIPSAIAGLANAYYAGAPVVVLNSRLPGKWEDASAPVDHDKQAMIGAVTKWSRVVPSIDRLAEYLETAFRMSQAGKPGPVVLTIPREMYAAQVPVDPIMDWPVPEVPVAAPDPERLRAFVEDFRRAKRPIIVAGAGVVWSNASASLNQLASEWMIPVLGKALGRGIVSERSSIGYAFYYGLPLLAESDFVIQLGTRLQTHEKFGLPPLFSSRAKFCQIDIDPMELGRTRPVAHAFLSDCRVFLDAWSSAMRDARVAPWPMPGWIDVALQHRRRGLVELEASSAGKLHPYQIARSVARVMDGKNCTFVIDGGYPGAWATLALEVDAGSRFMDLAPLGQMGTGTPLAIGAAAAAKDAAPHSPVVLLTGDGSFGYYMSSLSEAARASLRLVVVVFNDCAWGSELNIQVRDKIGRAVNTQLGRLDYSQVASGLGCWGRSVNDLNALGAALDEALAAKGPAVIDAQFDVRDALVLHDDERLTTIGFHEYDSALRRLVTVG